MILSVLAGALKRYRQARADHYARVATFLVSADERRRSARLGGSFTLPFGR